MYLREKDPKATIVVLNRFANARKKSYLAQEDGRTLALLRQFRRENVRVLERGGNPC
ncbi:MAG: hypothetical protein IJG15_05300 [Lachnospiraceae bacterium]|nr:hypothetical protein [Lachnospiraceae bacterium]